MKNGYPALRNLVLVFPRIVLAFIACTLITAIAAVWLLHAHKSGTFEVRDALKLMQPRW